MDRKLDLLSLFFKAILEHLYSVHNQQSNFMIIIYHSLPEIATQIFNDF